MTQIFVFLSILAMFDTTKLAKYRMIECKIPVCKFWCKVLFCGTKIGGATELSFCTAFVERKIKIHRNQLSAYFLIISHLVAI